MPAGFPRTEEILRRAGLRVQSIDVSELQKAEGSVTCISVIFESAARSHRTASHHNARPAAAPEAQAH